MTDKEDKDRDDDTEISEGHLTVTNEDSGNEG